MLFSPIIIGNLALKNRIIMPAIDLGFCPDGMVNKRMIQFYRERAQGGAGLIMVGGAAIDTSGIYGGFTAISDDTMVEGHQELASAIKKAGAIPGIQLFHSGRYSFAYVNGGQVVAPSPVPSRLTGHVPRELTISEIKDLVIAFGEAAVRAQKAGYQVIEVISSAGYLINQFLSPLTNRREDEYGGSFENRMRFGLEVVRTIRSRAGSEAVLSVRLGGSDFMPGSNTWREMSVFAAELEKASVNMLNVTGGWHEAGIPLIQAEVPRGGYAYLAGKIKEKVSIPVAATNRINDPRTAEKILNNGQADLISVARGFLADEHWAVKASKRPETIRRCIGCMTCLEQILNHEMTNVSGVLCAINPRCGFETGRVIKPALESKKVLIIGAGPAGLEAARVTALQGHRVMIWEKSDRIGGQWNIAHIPPGKEEFASLTAYYKNVLPLLGVEIAFNKEADLTAVKAEEADHIIVASGARPAELKLPANEDAYVINAWDVLSEKPLIGKKIVVVGGGSVGCETAAHIAEIGTIDASTVRFMMLNQSEDPETIRELMTRGTYNVSIIEAMPRLATDMVKGMRWTVIKHLKTMGVGIHMNTSVKEITADGIRVIKEGREELIKADTVVIAIGSKSEQALYEELKKNLDNVILLGDAVQPGKVMDAIHSAFTIVNDL